MPRSVPFSILTGWLGSGKTTTLNQLLSTEVGGRVAVLVNELGRIAIDTRQIVGGGGDVLELAGGCVCCKVDVRSDLWDGIAEVIKRSAPDHVVLETTGIAEPAALLENLHRVPEEVRGQVAPAGVICVVDAEVAPATIAERDEAREQILTADRLLLRKLDRATATQVAVCHAQLDALNPSADRASFPDDSTGRRALAAWMLEVREPRQRPVRHRHGGDAHHGHHHGGQLSAIVFTDDVPLVVDRVLAVLEDLGPNLVRAKGFVHDAIRADRAFVERAGASLAVTRRDAWPGPTRMTELVLIGDHLDENKIRGALWACRSGSTALT